MQVLGRDIAQRPERERELLPNVVYLRLALGVFTYGLLGASLVVFGFDDTETRAALIAGLILLIVIDSFRSALEVRLRLAWISIADAVEAIATVAGALVLIRRGAGPEAFLWMYAGLKLVNALMVWAAASRMGEFSWRPRPELWPPLVRSALPLGLAGLLMALYFRLDVMILARLKPPDDVGQYGAGYRFLEAFTVLPTMIMSVLAPVLARSFMEGSGVLQRRYGLAMHLVSVIAIGVSVGGAMTAWRVLPALPGFSAYDGGGVALAILSPAAGLILVGTIAQGALTAAHRQQRLLRISAAGLAFNLLLNLLLIPPYSYVGAAIATTATEVLLVALSLREVRLRLSLHWPLARLWPVLGATAAMAAAIAATYGSTRSSRSRSPSSCSPARSPSPAACARGTSSRSGTFAHDRAARRRRDAVPARVGHAPAQRAPRPPAGRAARGRDGRARAAGGRARRAVRRRGRPARGLAAARPRGLGAAPLQRRQAPVGGARALRRRARAGRRAGAGGVGRARGARRRAAGDPRRPQCRARPAALVAAAEPRRLHRARWRWEARKAGGWEGARVREATPSAR